MFPVRSTGIGESANGAMRIQGYHRFAAALLGSVALTCVQRAHCPVVIVRQPDD